MNPPARDQLPTHAAVLSDDEIARIYKLPPPSPEQLVTIRRLLRGAAHTRSTVDA
jgi:hypothetical protein